MKTILFSGRSDHIQTENYNMISIKDCPNETVIHVGYSNMGSKGLKVETGVYYNIHGADYIYFENSNECKVNYELHY